MRPHAEQNASHDSERIGTSPIGIGLCSGHAVRIPDGGLEDGRSDGHLDTGGMQYRVARAETEIREAMERGGELGQGWRDSMSYIPGWE